ncbi:MAG: heme exporter protein CcmB [Rhodospirillaceae bacterium]|nr:heme exporter protein CcmB [Rhodospirillaceae bacterium]
MIAFLALIGRDLRLSFRQGGDSAMVIAFFLLATMLFPLGIGPEPALLERVAPGLAWVAALLAAMLSLERMFLADYEDGSLELIALAPLPLEAVALAKAIAHWLTTGLPLTLAAPILAVLLNLNADARMPLFLALLIGTPCLSLIGTLGAALVLGARRGGVLLPLLVLPLATPVLIFGAGAVELARIGADFSSQLLLLGAILAIALPLAPIAAAAALRQALE